MSSSAWQRARAGLGRGVRRHAVPARLVTEVQASRLRSREYAEAVRLARRGTLAVDVGAYVGTFALGMSRAVGRKGLVLALEPNPAAYRQLVNATWASRVVALNLAASEVPGTGRIAVPYDSGRQPAVQRARLNGAGTDAAEWYDVNLARIDDLIGTSHPVSLIKLDVEGHETESLRGAARTIAEHHPALIVEIEQRHLGEGRTVDQVVNYLLDQGYRCHCIGRDGQLFPWRDFDVRSDQLRWLTPTGDLPVSHLRHYTNNFVFT